MLVAYYGSVAEPPPSRNSSAEVWVKWRNGAQTPEEARTRKALFFGHMYGSSGKEVERILRGKL